MSAYLEVMVKGGCRAYLEAAAVVGVITSPGMTADSMATTEEPISLVMRSGETLPGVYGLSPNRLLFYCAGAKLIQRQEGRLVVVAYLDQQAEFEEKVAAYVSRGQDG